MNTEHTIGPWRVGQEHGESQLRPSIQIMRDVTYVEGIKPVTYVIGEVTYPTTIGDTAGRAERQANARLIAAAPEMFAEIEREYIELADIHNEWPGRNTPEGQMKLIRLRNLIAKATGRSEEVVQNEYSVRAAITGASHVHDQ